MIEFDPSDPFPLLPPERQNYRDEQRHSAEVDSWLGLETARIESELLRSARIPDQQAWIGLPVESMLTPYTEIRGMLARLDLHPGSRLVDLGAGYGRMGFVVGRHYPEVEFIGYELMEARVAEGLRALAGHSFPNVRLITADLASEGFVPEAGDFYFLYDFGTRVAIEKCLQDLRLHARSRPIAVIGRGRASRDAIERRHPWLSQVTPPLHCGCFAIYRTAIS